jgi:aspartate aminotransferase
MSTPFQAARRLDNVSESATLKLNALVQQFKAQGKDVINLTAGEPDFPVPDACKRAVEEALRKDLSKYTPAAGWPDLRSRVARKTNQQQPSVVKSQGEWKSSHVVVTNGGKQAIFNALMALVDPGDEVIITAPYWLSYPEMVKLCGGIPKIVNTSFEQRFRMSPEQLKAALGPKTRAILINSPSNPTGAMYTREELAALGDVVLSHAEASRAWVISDEIYDRIILGEVPFTSFAEACPAMASRTVTVNGLSKSAAMTGWRVGWSVAPEPITAVMGTVQGQTTSGINSLAQAASMAALDLPESAFAEQVSTYRRRRDLALEILGKAARLKVMVPMGAFYVFVGVEQHFKPGEDSSGFCERALTEAGVALVPGGPFGDPGSVRLSFATDEASLAAGCRRLSDFLGRS